MPKVIFEKDDWSTICLLYTSDAADDMQCVGMGEQRICGSITTVNGLSLFKSNLYTHKSTT